MSLQVNKQELKIALMIIPFFTFAVGFKWPLIGMLVITGRYLVLSFLIFIALCKGKIVKLARDKSFQLLMLLYCVIGISTFVNNGSMNNVLQLIMYGITPYLLMSNYWEYESGRQRVLGGINLAFTFLTVLNLLIMFIYPNGIYTASGSGVTANYYLFGSKNQMVAPLLIGMVFFIEYSYKRFGKITISTILKCSACIIALLIGESGTGIVMMGLFTLLLSTEKRISKKLTPNTSYIVLIVLFVLVVIYQMLGVFSYFIEDVLHKSITLSNRTYIWEAALLSIRQNPLIGTGVSDGLTGNVLLKLDYISRDTFAHDMYLDFAIMGGVTALVIFCLYLIKIKNYYLMTKMKNEKMILWWGFWLYLIASLVEIYPGNYCMFLVTAYFVLENKNKESSVLICNE